MNQFQFANRIGYTDVNPFEVIRHVTEKCVEVRAMDAELDRNFKPKIIPGGFAGHCTNNTEREQQWIIKANPANAVRRVRLHKNGQWKDKYGNRYMPGDAPRKFYDYNF